MAVQEMGLAANPVKDRRLFKMLNDAHPKVPAILDYIRKNCALAGQTAPEPTRRRSPVDQSVNESRVQIAQP